MAQEPHDVDFDRAAKLLAVIDGSVAHSGKLGHLANAAMTELLAMNKGLEEHATKEHRKQAEAEKARQVKLQAEIDKKAKENVSIVEQEEKDRILAEARARAQREVPADEVDVIRRPPSEGAVGAPRPRGTRVMTPEEEAAAERDEGIIPGPKVVPRRELGSAEENGNV